MSNSQSQQTISKEKKKKSKDDLESQKVKCETTLGRYKQALVDLNAYKSRYREDMHVVYKKCDTFEKMRMEFFIEKFIKFQSHLNMYENCDRIFEEFVSKVKQSNPEKDLTDWSNEFGANMTENYPVFEEYSEELKTISKSRASKRLETNNRITNTILTQSSNDKVIKRNLKIQNSKELNFSKSMVHVREKIRIRILKNLKSQPATKRIIFSLNENEHDYLISKYNLNNKFRSSCDFVNDFKLKKIERFYLNKQKILINLKSFKIKNTMSRPFEIYNNKLKKIKCKEEDKISIKFTIKTVDLRDKGKKKRYENVLDDLIANH